jgi:hypothetical protein
VVSLAEKELESGAYRRNIVKSLNPAFYGIQPSAFILQTHQS